MAEKRYYWLKLYEDFFSSKRVKKLRGIAGGDTYTIIYLKMLLKAMKDDGYLYFDGIMQDFAEELALDLDEKADDVRVAVNYLLSVGLMESNAEDVYKLTYMEKMVGSETASAQRARDFRSRQKALRCNDYVTERNDTVTEASREANVDIDIEKEKEKIYKDVCASTEKKKFTPPSVEDVRAYCQERKNSVDPETFVNFYESNGWKVGRNAMKDWKAAVRTWERNRFSKPKEKFGEFQNKGSDLDELQRMLTVN